MTNYSGMLRAHEFASKGETHPSFRFGMDKAASVAALRRLATMVENDEVLLQSATIFEEATVEDFVLTTLLVSYAAKEATEVKTE